MKKALIIFVRNPEKGKVKTRLAATIGEERALSIYLELLTHTHTIAAAADADKFIFYADEVRVDDCWVGARFSKELQGDYDLGRKMKEAFSIVFEKGYQQAIIIGSDCLELSTAIIEEAFEVLKQKDIVLGPAADGGYYLLGMTKLVALIFENKEWSTETVFNQTVEDLQRENISYSALITLTDVDTEADWIKTKFSIR